MLFKSDIVLNLYEKMSEQNVISAYHGEFNQMVIDMLLKQAKWDLQNRKVDIGVLKKTYGVLVECLENIYKHTSMIQNNKWNRSNAEGIVVFSQEANQYRITVGNLIRVEQLAELKKRLDEVNKLDKKGLREKHETILKDTSVSDKGGAGLGIIDIALKSGNKLGYSFTPYNEEFTFFALQVHVLEAAGHI